MLCYANKCFSNKVIYRTYWRGNDRGDTGLSRRIFFGKLDWWEQPWLFLSIPACTIIPCLFLVFPRLLEYCWKYLQTIFFERNLKSAHYGCHPRFFSQWLSVVHQHLSERRRLYQLNQINTVFKTVEVQNQTGSFNGTIYCANAEYTIVDETFSMISVTVFQPEELHTLL